MWNLDRAHGALGFVAALLLLGVTAGGSAGGARALSPSARNAEWLGGPSQGAMRALGPDARLYALQPDGTIEVFSDVRDAGDDEGVAVEALSLLGEPGARKKGDDAGIRREATGIVVAGTATNPIIYASWYATSRADGDGGARRERAGDAGSGTITRLSWVGTDLDDPRGFWEAVDLVGGLPGFGDGHATHGLELVSAGSGDYLVVVQGESTGAGSSSTSLAWTPEDPPAAALLTLNLTELEALPIPGEGVRERVFDLAAIAAPTPAGADASGPSDPGAGDDEGPQPTASVAAAATAAAGSASWIDLNEDESYTGRHECSFVQAGDKWYLFGGREQAQKLDTYDFTTDSWSVSASPPVEFNHFQATEHQGLIWVIGAFETNSFPNEDPADYVAVYDPANDVWMRGPDVPPARRRGGAGLVVYDDRFYVVGGNTIGHNGGYVPWLDVFDPETGSWTALADAPHARDHFHAIVVGDELFALGGRLSGGPGGTFAPLIPEVDVYDLTTSTWSTLPATSNIPTPRAASGVAWFDGLVMVMGGEDASQAWNVVEGFDPLTGAWQTLPSMNYTRHGTQAIVSGQGVYILAGSPNKGGGNQRNMEVYNADAPAGTPSVAGELAGPAQAFVTGAGTATIPLDHVAGNQGVYVTDISLSGIDSPSFALASPPSNLRLVPVGGSLQVGVDYYGGAALANATLEVTHSGGQVESVQLVPEPGALPGAACGALGLIALGRRRRRAGGPREH